MPRDGVNSGASRVARFSGGVFSCPGRRPAWTGARSVRPSRGWRSVKTCARELERVSPHVHHPLAVRRRRAGTASPWTRRHPGLSRIQPEAGIAWHTQPEVGSSALPAGGHSVRGELPGGSSSEPRPGSWRSRSAGPARVACSRARETRTTEGRRSSRRAARARRRTRLSRDGRRCTRLHRPGTACAVAGRLLLHADFAHRRGMSAPPWSPEGSQKTPRASASSPARISWRLS